MMVLQIYAYGGGFKARLHHCATEGDAPCNDDCYEYSVQRCYPERDASPAETRQLLAAVAASAVATPGISHSEFLTLCGDDHPLFRL
uniref:Uncharacterized protein n=1 Tax=uncultured prokaryote TaxID=198431 RepID=A0A0H5Q3S1_9ZZZZ|nr:hypothetical protein [uncultured prokaryote]